MEVTDIGNKEEGRVWHRKPGPGKRLLVTVVRTAQQSKTVRFLHVAFDTTGDSFLAGDHHGNIYVFDIGRNRFRLVQKTGQACTALAFSLRRTTEFLVALADHTIKCFDKDTKQMVSWMQGHEGAVSFISVHSSGRSAISTSLDTAQLWDLDTFQRKRKLSVRQSVGVQRVFFLPLSNTILSCFSDDSIFAWESDTLSCQYQLPVPDSGPQISYKAFAVAPDGKSLVAGGRSNLIHLWCLDSQQLVRVIQMPTQVRAVRQLEFLPDSFDRGASQTLGVLSQDGVMRFINIQTCKLLFHLGSCDHAISTVAISPNGRHMAAIMDNGSINVYSIHGLTQEFNKLPSSQVVVVSGGEDDQELSKPKVRVRSDIIEKSTKRSGKQSQAKIPTGFPVDDKENEQAAGLSKKRLLSLLKAFGEYPAKYRMFLWRSLLCLPENYTAYSSLTDKGPHSAFLTLHNKYPIKSHKLQRCLQRVLSALAHWAAIFGEVDYLPLVAFPFVKLFQNNPLLCFEMLATVIVNWCQHWFEYFPNPPLNILGMVENVLAHHDKKLLQHLVNCGITSQVYAWPLLETLFSEVLTRDEWLRLFDSVFSNHPSFLLMACVAYVTCCRQPLLKSSQKQDFEYFFHHRNNMDVGNMIKEAYRIMDSTPSDIHPKNMLSDFTPLTKDQYPVFNHYPGFIVEYQSRKREKIRLKEMEHLCEREELSAQRADFMRRKAEEEAFYTQEAGEHCRAQEEERLAAGQDLDVRRMELEAQRRRLEQHLLMEQERLDREVEHEVAMSMKRSAEEENNTDLLHSTHTNIQAPGASLKRLDVVQERKRGNVTELQKQAVAEEAGLADTMRDVVGREWDEVMNTRAQLEERRQQQASGEAVRKTQMGGFPHRPCGTPAAVAGSSTAGQVVRPSVTTSLTETGTRMICLNSTSPSGSTSTIFSVNRGRAQLDSSERELLMEVRELRQKLANRARKEDSCAS